MTDAALLLYPLGVATGMVVMWVIYHQRIMAQSEVVKPLLAETIGQHAYLRATREIVDEDTDERIEARGAEILDEYDLDAVDPEVVERVE